MAAEELPFDFWEKQFTAEDRPTIGAKMSEEGFDDFSLPGEPSSGERPEGNHDPIGMIEDDCLSGNCSHDDKSTGAGGGKSVPVFLGNIGTRPEQPEGPAEEKCESCANGHPDNPVQSPARAEVVSRNTEIAPAFNPVALTNPPEETKAAAAAAKEFLEKQFGDGIVQPGDYAQQLDVLVSSAAVPAQEDDVLPLVKPSDTANRINIWSPDAVAEIALGPIVLALTAALRELQRDNPSPAALTRDQEAALEVGLDRIGMAPGELRYRVGKLYRRRNQAIFGGQEEIERAQSEAEQEAMRATTLGASIEVGVDYLEILSILPELTKEQWLMALDFLMIMPEADDVCSNGEGNCTAPSLAGTKLCGTDALVEFLAKVDGDEDGEEQESKEDLLVKFHSLLQRHNTIDTTMTLADYEELINLLTTKVHLVKIGEQLERLTSKILVYEGINKCDIPKCARMAVLKPLPGDLESSNSAETKGGTVLDKPGLAHHPYCFNHTIWGIATAWRELTKKVSITRAEVGGQEEQTAA